MSKELIFKVCREYQLLSTDESSSLYDESDSYIPVVDLAHLNSLPKLRRETYFFGKAIPPMVSETSSQRIC